MENKTKRFAYWLEVAALGIVLGLVIQAARAWTEPSMSPPGGDVGAPINTSDVQQAKGGPLTVNSSYSFLNGLGVVGNALISGNVGIGTIGPAQKLHIVGGKGQADDFCLNSDTTKCLTNSGGGSGGQKCVCRVRCGLIGNFNFGSFQMSCNKGKSWKTLKVGWGHATGGCIAAGGRGGEEIYFDCWQGFASGPPSGNLLSSLSASWYGNKTLSGDPILSNSPDVIDFTNYSVPGYGTSEYSVKITGNVKSSDSGKYTFYTLSDDGVKLWVNGQKLIDNWTDHGATENSGSINLDSNVSYPIVIEHYQGGVDERLAVDVMKE